MVIDSTFERDLQTQMKFAQMSEDDRAAKAARAKALVNITQDFHGTSQIYHHV